MTTRTKVHCIGIGGIGVSALARYFLAQKWAVSGSDTAVSKITRDLIKEGVQVKIGHKKANISKDIHLIIASQAVRPANPELQAAKKLHIPILTYPQAVGRLTNNRQTIAVAGAHGKSTTTALMGLILKKAGLQPTIIIGTNLKELGNKNFEKGKGPYLVLEADEWKAAFLNYSPTYAIVTNIDREHLDFYKSLSAIKKAFIRFLSNVKHGGTLVLNRDDHYLHSLHTPIRKIVEEKQLRVIWYSLRNKNASTIRRVIQIPGTHNISNALAAYTLARVLGIPKKVILKTINTYKGAWRRFEYRGKFHASSVKGQVLVYDDYAHHPTEIKATLQAFREKFPTSQLVCVFEPHQAKRLKDLFREFTSSFEEADTLLLLPIYKVAGRDQNYLTYNSRELVKIMQKKYSGKPIFYLENPKNLKNALTTLLTTSPNDLCVLSPTGRKSSTRSSVMRQSAVVVMMGAGNIFNLTDSLIK